jgi:hypothetical protein
VKAETQQIDLSDAIVAFSAALSPVDAGQGNAMTGAVQPVCRADLSSTQVYVWHCALII